MDQAKRCDVCGSYFMGGACPDCPAATEVLPEPTLQPGEKFRGFEILEVLGQGGMGVVYKARQPSLDRFVALKILTPLLARSRSFQLRFEREAKVLASLAHPRIVGVHDSGREGDVCFLALEYVEAGSLRERMSKGRLPAAEAVRIASEICEGLEFAHGLGVVHRDIKPENILLDRKGDVKIADFGLAKMAQPTDGIPVLTQSGQAVGTIRYMAPEQSDHPAKVDHRADLYAVGVVLYEMLTGTHPIHRVPTVCAELPALNDAVMKALETDPLKRYQTAAELRSAIASALKPARKSRPYWIAIPVLACAAAAAFFTTRDPRVRFDFAPPGIPRVEKKEAPPAIFHAYRRLELPARAVAFQPGTHVLATGGIDGVVRLWDADTGRETLTLPGHGGAVERIAFPSPGTALIQDTFATASQDKTVRIWHIRQKKQISSFFCNQVPLDIAYVPKRREIVMAGAEGGIRFLDLDLLRDNKTVPTQAVPLTCIAVSGDRFATAAQDRSVKIWNSKGEEIRAFLSPDPVREMMWLDGVFVTSDETTVRYWDEEGKPRAAPEGILALRGAKSVRLLERGREVQVIELEASPFSIAFSTDGRLLAIGRADGVTALWTR